MHAELDRSTVITANAQFWEQMVAISVAPLPQSEPLCLEPGHIDAWVTLSGAWNGRVDVKLSGRLAHHAAAALMMQPVETVQPADALDATREIANIIAGVIKPSLPRPSSMAIPEAEVQSSSFHAPGAGGNALVVSFGHAAGKMLVCVSETAT